MLQPQTKANELLDKLNAAKVNLSVSSEFLLASIERDAKKLITTDPFGAYNTLGALEAIRFNEDKSIQNHEKAIRLSPSIVAFDTYSVSLDHLSLTSRAIEMRKKALQLDPFNLSYIEILIDWTGKCGKFNESISWMNEYKKLSPDTDLREKFNIEEVKSYIQFYSKHALNDNTVSEYIELAGAVLRRNKVVSNHRTVTFSFDKSFISFMIYLDYNESIVQMVQSDFLDVLSNLDLDPILPIFIPTQIRHFIK